MAGRHGGLAAPGAIAVPNATNGAARRDARRAPDHELTRVLLARMSQDVLGIHRSTRSSQPLPLRRGAIGATPNLGRFLYRQNPRTNALVCRYLASASRRV